MQKMLLPLGLLLLACGGGSGSPAVAPVSSSPQAVVAFMQAAADSNLTRMAELWGTSRGPASVTHEPQGYDRRLVVLQAYLRGDSTKILSDVAIPGDDSRRRVSMALYRSGCMKQIPVTTVRTSNAGWLVQNVEISFAGNPARPCEP